MKLSDILKILADLQHVRLVFGDDALEGNVEAIDRYVSGDVLKSVIVEMKTDGDVLNIWME